LGEQLTQRNGSRERVLHLVPALFGQRRQIAGGAERYAHQLARHQAVHVPTRLMTFGSRDEIFTDGPLTIEIVGGDWSRRGVHDPVSRRIVGAVRASTIVHCHQRSIRMTKLAGAAGRALGRRTFVTDHGGGAWGPGVWLPDRGLFDAHLFVSEFSRRVHPEPDGVSYEVVFGGVDHHFYRPSKNNAGSNNVIFVGRVLPHKGIDMLIEALPNDVSLKVIGPQIDARYLADLEQLAVDRQVTFHLGWSDDQLAEAYREALCVVLPSVYVDRYGNRNAVPELLGQTLLEGMASGIPAICTQVGGMPEIVEHGVTGFVVPPNDPAALQRAILALRSDAYRRDEIGRAARASIERRFTWEAAAIRCLQAYGVNV
jgi:glycosyltransferase involved in cell wall biosynthesis